MYKPKAQTIPIGRLILRAWLLTGLLVVGYGLILSGCTAVVPEQTVTVVTDQIVSVQMAEDAFVADRITTYGQIWKEENGEDGDRFSAGLSAWQLAAATEDPAWANTAIDAFRDVLKQQPDMIQAKAWLGSAHALMARDFPVQGLWQIIPGPGFVRLYHVERAFSNLDDAVGVAPKDPVVRLIRASTYLGMPSIFGGHEEGHADFELIAQWIANPQLNPEYADIITSQTWQQEYFLSCARAMASAGKAEQEDSCWQQLSTIAEDPLIRKLAKWHLN